MHLAYALGASWLPMVGKEDAMGGGDIADGYHLMKRNRREKKSGANGTTPRIRTCVAAAAGSEMETLAQQCSGDRWRARKRSHSK